ncbi:MAG: hypothetical protein WEE89_15950 [Gemmatimonadota bacterium]
MENAEPVWNEQTAWRLDSAAIVRIGDMDGPAEYQFHRVVGSLKLRSGEIVVANAGSAELRFYDISGKHIRSAGRTGEGPGEYGFLRFLRRFGSDSLITWDARFDRGTILSSNGSFGRTFMRQRMRGFTHFVDGFPDGALLGFSEGSEESPVEAVSLIKFQSAGSIRADRSLLIRVDQRGHVHEIGKFFVTETFAHPDGGTASLPFARRGVAAAAHDAVYFGSAESFEIRRFTLTGQLNQIIRTQRPNAPLTRSMITEYIETSLGRMKNPAARADWQRRYSEMTFPETIPAFSDLVVDPAGNLWVGDYHDFGETQPHWTVFDRAGRLLGTLDVPANLMIHDIGADYVLGRTLDGFAVERIALYRLLKPGD